MNYYETLAAWHQAKMEIKRLQEVEKTLREGLFRGSFPDVEEGTRNLVIPPGVVLGERIVPPGTKLKGTGKVNRSVKTERWNALDEAKRKAILGTGAIITKPDLVLSAYRKLGDDALRLVETVMEIKPGTPELKLVFPDDKDDE